MKVTLTSLMLLLAYSGYAWSFPEIKDRFHQVDTLGQNFTLIDGIQGNDTLPKGFRLHVKRANSPLKDWELLLQTRVEESRLTLADGRPITTYAWFKTDPEGKTGVIVGSVSPVHTIDISLVADVKEGSDIQVMFNDTSAQVMEPKRKDIAVFDFDLDRQHFRAQKSSQAKARNLIFMLIDKSGSMVGQLPGLANSGR